MNRRDFLRVSTASIAAPAIVKSATINAQSNQLQLNIASYRLDRTAALFDGKVEIDGVDATFAEGAIGDMNTAAFSGNGKWEISELGLHPFMLAHANDGFRDYALLPIFLLRQFRQKSVFVHADAGIQSPQDLRGRRVGTPGYSSTSLTWIRGILEDEYGVKPSDMEWVISNKDSSAGEAGKASDQESQIPEGVTVMSGKPGMDESELLLAGEVDVLIHAATPAAYIQGDKRVIRLFPDVREVEMDYYRRTGIFPIMHTLAVRRDIAADHPWLARAVFDAYSESKALAYAQKDRLTWATDMLPWYGHELEATRKLMGRNFYSYGVALNRKTLETLFAYSHRQGLASRLLTVEEVFLPGSLEFEE